MPGKSYAEIANSITIMISGLKNNADRIQKRGIGKDFITNFEAKHGEIETLNNEHEALKAKLKTKTEELNEKLSERKVFEDEAKKVIKLEFDKSQWKEFGIDDKR